jgi:signal transduction histidine kinase
LNIEEQMVTMFACEVHDGPCQELAAALYHLEAARRLQAMNSDDAGREFDGGMTRLRRGIQELRKLVSGLRPLHIEGRSLRAAIEDLIREYAVDHGLHVTSSYTPQDLDLPAALQTAVFRIIQEGMANVQRHSRSKTARVRITQTDDSVLFEIDDWGIGFDPTTVRKDCFGIAGMRARAAFLGGEVCITSHPGKGTLVVARIPIVRTGSGEQSPTVGE